MKTLIALITAMLLTGCVCTRVKMDRWEFERTAFIYNAKLPKLSVTTAGTLKLEGYDGEIDPEFVTALEKVVTELIKKGLVVP